MQPCLSETWCYWLYNYHFSVIFISLIITTGCYANYHSTIYPWPHARWWQHHAIYQRKVGLLPTITTILLSGLICYKCFGITLFTYAGDSWSTSIRDILINKYILDMSVHYQVRSATPIQTLSGDYWKPTFKGSGSHYIDADLQHISATGIQLTL